MPGLLQELDTTIARQASAREGIGGSSAGFDEDASDARAQLVEHLAAYAGLLVREHPPIPERARAVTLLLGTPRGQAALLASSRHLPAAVWVPDLHRALADAQDAATRAIDRPPDRTLAGWCGCGCTLYAVDGHPTVRCPRCGTTWPVEDSRAALLARLPGLAARALTKVELALLCGIPVGTLHRWSSEHRITSCGVNAKGQPLFSAGPVIEAARTGIPPEKHPEVSMS